MDVARLPRLAFWALAAVALAASHDLVWLVQVGPGDALVRALRGAAHGYWGIASAAIGVVAVAAGIAAAVRLLRLRRRARTVDAPTELLPERGYRARVLRTWVPLLAIVLIGFAVQENVEHFVAHGHLPGLGALVGPEYPLALPVIVVITGMAALLAAALHRAEQRLLDAIAAAMARWQRPPSRLVRPPQRLRPHPTSPLATASAGRAPPALLVVDG